MTNLGQTLEFQWLLIDEVRSIIAGHGNAEGQKKHGDVGCDPEDEVGGAAGAG